MPGIDHIHSETEMLQVEDHLNHVHVQSLIHCLDTEDVCHHITIFPHQVNEGDNLQTIRRTHSGQFPFICPCSNR